MADENKAVDVELEDVLVEVVVEDDEPAESGELEPEVDAAAESATEGMDDEAEGVEGAGADEAEGASEAAEKNAEAEARAARDAARKARHDERVASIAARFAALVAKGEEIVSSIEAKADAADASFGEKREAADVKVENLAEKFEAKMTQLGEQFAADLDLIAQSVTKGAAAADKDAPEQAAGEEAAEEKATTEDAADGQVSEVVSDSTEAAADAPADEATDAPRPYQPQFTPAAKALRERMRVGTHSDLMLTDPEFVERFANFAFDDVPSDVDLPDRTRFMCWLATLLGCQGIDEFRALLPAALNVGVEPVAVKEIVYQAAAYLGIGRVYPFLKATNEALVATGVELPLPAQANTEPIEASRYLGGEDAQVKCFGEQMHGYKDRGAADYPWIAQWLVKNCFGDWYTRGGLTIAEREMITFCFIAAQGGCEPQLRSHTAANVQCGNDRAFLIKVVSNNVPFIGYPRSLNAMAVVEEVTGAKE